MNKHIIFGWGCFWGMEKLLSEFEGVLETSVGYAGGAAEDASYKDVSRGDTGHVESVKVTFDTSGVSLKKLIEFFFKIHDPTTLNRQGNDVGTQYRSVIFYNLQEQEEVAGQVIKHLNSKKGQNEQIVTTVEKEVSYHPAEDYHQKYLEKNPEGYTCHFIRD